MSSASCTPTRWVTRAGSCANRQTHICTKTFSTTREMSQLQSRAALATPAENEQNAKKSSQTTTNRSACTQQSWLISRAVEKGHTYIGWKLGDISRRICEARVWTRGNCATKPLGGTLPAQRHIGHDVVQTTQFTLDSKCNGPLEAGCDRSSEVGHVAAALARGRGRCARTSFSTHRAPMSTRNKLGTQPHSGLATWQLWHNTEDQ